jgi:hypothetical protein
MKCALLANPQLDLLPSLIHKLITFSHYRNVERGGELIRQCGLDTLAPLPSEPGIFSCPFAEANVSTSLEYV